MFRIDKTHIFGAFTLILCLCFAMVANAKTGDRVALIIGNSQYSTVPSLKNPKNDASDLADTLGGLGFEVTVKTDLDHSGLLSALRGFQRQARGSEVALIYYAGHGIEMAKQNYLIPTDAVLETDSDILFEAVPLENAVLAAEGARTLSLVIIDACRNNPFAAQIKRTNSTRSIGRGLAKLEPQGNTLIAYAAKDGTVAMDGEGRNSPYATALISALEEPRLEVGLMFRKVRDMVLETTGYQQEPFFYGSLSSKELFLNKTEEIVVAAVPVVTDVPVASELTGDKREVDLKVVSLIWDSIRQSRDPADFQDFLVSYPESPFAPYAQRALDRVLAAGKIADTKDTVEIASAVEAPVPPKVVVETPAAVAVEAPKAVLKQPKIAPATENTDLAMLEPPNTAVEEKISTTPEPEVVVERSLTRDEIREIQERLTVIKYKPGPIDGVMGKRTGQAISAYQKAKQLDETGKPSLAVLEALRSDVSEDEVAAFRADLAKRRAAWAAAQRKKKAQEAANAAAVAAQQAQAAAAAKAAAEAAAQPKRKRRVLEATDGDNSSSGGGGSSGGSSNSGSSGGGGGGCSGIC